MRECAPHTAPVARGEHALSHITPRLQAQAAARLSLADRAIFAMRLAGTAQREIAATVGLSVHDLDARTTSILATLSDGEEPAPPQRASFG